MYGIYMECLKCKEDISELINFDTLYTIIECPHCLNKMWVCYDCSYDEETNEEDQWWWLEQK